MSLCVFEATWRSLSPPYCPLTQPCCLLCGSLIRLLLDGPLRFLTNHLSRNHIGIVSSTPTNFRMANSHIHQRRQHNYSGRHAQTVTSDKRDIVSSKQAQSTTYHGGQNETNCMQVIGESLTKQGISAEATKIILKLRRKCKSKQYQSYYKKWHFCIQGNSCFCSTQFQ